MHTPLYSEEQIRDRVRAVAAQIDADYAGRTVDLVCLLGGASVFAADLLRALTIPARPLPFGFVSYPKGNATGEVRVTLDVAEPLNGRDVIVVEGIVITGRTPKYVMEMLRLREPASLAMCALGIKPKLLMPGLEVKYRAFEFGDEMAVGYGVGEGAEKALPYLVARQEKA